MLRLFIITLTLLLPGLSHAQSPSNAPRVGIDYTIISTPQPTFTVVPGKIEVAEVFSYACPACSRLQPQVTDWKKTLPNDVNFIYVHSVGQGAWERFARGFYAAEIKKIQPRTHADIFEAVFTKQTLSHNASLEEIAKFFAGYGVEEKNFLAIMNSPSVTAKTNKSKQFTIRTGANSTPTFIVAGKYRLQTTQDRGPQGLFSTINFLVAKERALLASRTAKPKPAPAAATK
jgi:protein dithiol oxidoreductase (disulfide-forming)